MKASISAFSTSAAVFVADSTVMKMQLPTQKCVYGYILEELHVVPRCCSIALCVLQCHVEPVVMLPV